MGRTKRERKASSSENESDSSKDEGSSNSSDAKEQAPPSPKQRKRQMEKEERVRPKEMRQDRNVERSRWESPDGRKRKHSPQSQNQRYPASRDDRRKGHRERQDGGEARTKWEKKERDRDIDRDLEKRRKEDNRSQNESDSQRRRERDAPERSNRNYNGENRPVDRFDGRRQNERKSPRRDERNRGFEERERGRHNSGRGGRRGGRGNRFGDGDGPRSSFDGSRVKGEPSPEWGKADMKKENNGKPIEKEKPNFEPSGKLTEDANTVNGVVIKYTEPMEARKPKRRWRLYPFKGEKALPTLYVHRQSAYLMGRDRKVADIPLDHPSCSKQHAALQFRLVSFQREDGGEGKRVRPYLIDLESANGTHVNDIKLEPKRYHELLERDVLRFGFSSREYVLLHEQSKDDALDDDVPFTSAVPK
ncbi:FHA domain-containing protein DDL [Neodiprion virginianus]|uniref:FHA domain-containing protein DDL n=1 Tax=Neodiprion virginianus TaxID=2961670 RepID=UPI001EE76BF9|nr:FHA domain-containing protein DDL [Neodiprion virginianus]XP_046627027.1 FHA domain-containing protein DDL [Neodiprion virginianus]